MKNLLISFLITGFLCGTSAHASSQGTSTSMVLRFENSTTCAAGETATTSGAELHNGRQRPGRLAGNLNQLFYSRFGNIDPREGTLEFWIRLEWTGNNGMVHIILKVGSS